MKNQQSLNPTQDLWQQQSQNENANQCSKILTHLQQFPITALDALNLYRCFRLAARIADLRKDGHVIETRMVKVDSGKAIAQYFLIKQ